MPHALSRPTRLMSVLLCLIGMRLTLGDDSTSASRPSETAEPVEQPQRDVPRLRLEQARERAVLMHEIYTATLDAMHERYFHGDRAVVPARAMEDVFRDMEDRTHSQARWISASFTAMSLDHEPKTEFEQLAATRLAHGEESVEIIEEGYYRRAGAIQLRGGCISCHSGMFGSTSPAKRFAGLVISIPVEAGARLTAATDDP